MINILANDGIDKVGQIALEEAGFNVDTNNIPQNELTEKLANYEVLLVRSATKVRKDLIDAHPHLKMIGRGGVGMDNIDVDYARSKGIAVVNTPAASSLSVAELVFSHLFGGCRFLHESNREMPYNGNAEFKTLSVLQACEIENIPCFDTRSVFDLTDYYAFDNHLNSSGARKMADFISSTIDGKGN